MDCIFYENLLLRRERISHKYIFGDGLRIDECFLSSSSSSLNYSLQSVQRINLQERIEITIRGRGRFQNIDETREDVLRRLFE